VFTTYTICIAFEGHFIILWKLISQRRYSSATTDGETDLKYNIMKQGSDFASNQPYFHDSKTCCPSEMQYGIFFNFINVSE